MQLDSQKKKGLDATFFAMAGVSGLAFPFIGKFSAEHIYRLTNPKKNLSILINLLSIPNLVFDLELSQLQSCKSYAHFYDFHIYHCHSNLKLESSLLLTTIYIIT